MKFAIRIEEVIGKTVIVEAENLEVAIKKVEEAADNGEFLFDEAEDFVSRKIRPLENKFLGTIVEWENQRWYVDNTDENFKDETEETSLFLLPEKYADADENDRLMRYGKPDSIGFWVHESDVTEIKG